MSVKEAANRGAAARGTINQVVFTFVLRVHAGASWSRIQVLGSMEHNRRAGKGSSQDSGPRVPALPTTRAAREPRRPRRRAVWRGARQGPLLAVVGEGGAAQVGHLQRGVRLQGQLHVAVHPAGGAGAGRVGQAGGAGRRCVSTRVGGQRCSLVLVVVGRRGGRAAPQAADWAHKLTNMHACRQPTARLLTSIPAWRW